MKRAVPVLLVLGLFCAGFATSAGADDEPDPRTQREEVRRKKAEAAAELDALQADADQVESALDDLAENISFHEALLTEAQDAQAEANQQVDTARAEVAAVEARIAVLEDAVKKAALLAYTSSGSSGDLVSTITSGNAADSLQQQVLYGLATDDLLATIDELDAAHRDLEAAQRRATAAAERADHHRADVDSKLSSLRQSVDDAESLSDRVDERINDTLAEAAALESLDTKLSSEIAQQEAALAAKLAAQKEARDRAKAKSGSSGGGSTSGGSSKNDNETPTSGGGSSNNGSGGSSGGGSTPDPTEPPGTDAPKGTDPPPATDPPKPPDPPDVPDVPVIEAPNGLVKVNGITVDASIGNAIAQLVEWAAADGIRLTGGGYRSADDQIRVRRSNCGTSYYDIYQKPASQCHPPAARPGTSMHEKGLAVDFVCNGSLITSYGSSCYSWMAAHAPKVGLHNRRGGGEAWHWSTNGN